LHKKKKGALRHSSQRSDDGLYDPKLLSTYLDSCFLKVVVRNISANGYLALLPKDDIKEEFKNQQVVYRLNIGQNASPEAFSFFKL
jgi:hypothetical protein